ncbi:F-actin-capping protein subunit alpha [Spiromyces aspiralis]|uniref:F-actin-capping protein subunit alpha n=1 Tax=Spiromyces aspiralis TaxID=68401 RepID=A0ACC1HTE5_9FUNG|nr:F-actin-capping protein subunit alpha [Spiromyces aspiralis]
MINNPNLNVEDKIAKASAFLLSSPPGEEDDVFNDVRGLINDDKALQANIVPILAQLNKDRFLCVDVPDMDSKTLITKYNQLEDDKYVDFNAGKVVIFDHLRGASSGLHTARVICTEDYQRESALGDLRSCLQKNMSEYIEDRYRDGVGAVFISQDDSHIVICLLNNKFSPDNFWNGSWRSTWTLNPASGSLEGKVTVHIHYYEDGNVQQISEHSFQESVEPTDEHAALSLAVIKKIRILEQQYHRSLNDYYSQIADKAFKEFRRVLPLTRSKIDWDKVTTASILRAAAS